MSNTVAIIATADTKGQEIDFLRSEINAAGLNTCVIDFGVMGDPSIAVDISATEVAQKAGKELAALREEAKREVASAAMTTGMIKIINSMIGEDTLHGVIGLGGTQGTEVATKVMRALPYGFPKVMFSTMASGDTSGFVGIRDITMMFAVSDILGLNPFTRMTLKNAAGAVAGMVKGYSKNSFKVDRPVIGMTNLGVLTQGTIYAIEKLNDLGFEVIVFHAVGSGGAAMEEMMREGIITAVFDYALGELADQMFGGIRACDDSRLTVAASLGLPQIIVPGGIDHLGILLNEPNTIPPAYEGRKSAFHNPVIFCPRTSAEENEQMMQEVAKRIKGAKHTSIVLPLKSVSSYSSEGAPLRDEAVDQALFKAAHKELGNEFDVIDVDADAESKAFVDQAIAILLQNINEATK